VSIAHILPVLARAERKANPLDHYRCAGWHAEWVTEHFGRYEIYMHSANRAGKTTTAAALAAALARGRPSLKAFDGSEIPIPSPRPRVTVGIGTPTYKIGEGSILDYVRAFLGAGEVKEGRTSVGTSVFHVEHRLSRAEDDWSVIYVYPYDGPLPEEVGLDAWFGDGPPPPEWIRAIRNRGKAGRPLYGLITATPAKTAEWEPILVDYPAVPRATPRPTAISANGRRASIQSSIYDNRFSHLAGCPGRDAAAGYCSCSCPDIVRQEAANEGMVDAKARLFGEHVDTRGGCPYDGPLLERWESLCTEPRETIRFVVQGERTGPSGLASVSLLCDLQVWEYDDPDDEYVVVVDPARGLDDGRHDPDGLHVRSRRTRSLVARASQFLGAWGLGAAAVEVARGYNNAELHVARGGGYGDSVLSAARVLGYWNLGRDRRAASAGRTAELGVVETATTRHQAMNAVAAMLQRGETRIPSRDVIRCLKNVIVNKDGKIEARPGFHDEDLILLGHGERILDGLGPMPERAEPENGARAAFNRSFRHDFGLDPDRPGRSQSGGGIPTDSGRW